MDRLDVVSVLGVLVLVGVSAVADRLVVAAAFGGFLCSIATWRLYGGRPWEALAWLSWVGSAVVVVVDPGGAAFAVPFFAFLLVGLGLLFGSRLDLLPDVWTVGTDSQT